MPAADIETLEEEIENLRYEVTEITDKMQTLCNECTSIETYYEIEEYCGSLVRRPVAFCPVHFDCGVPGCGREEEYEELEEICTAILKEITVLKEFGDAVGNGEVVR
jgi:hypothetical protein